MVSSSNVENGTTSGFRIGSSGFLMYVGGAQDEEAEGVSGQVMDRRGMGRMSGRVGDEWERRPRWVGGVHAKDLEREREGHALGRICLANMAVWIGQPVGGDFSYVTHLVTLLTSIFSRCWSDESGYCRLRDPSR